MKPKYFQLITQVKAEHIEAVVITFNDNFESEINKLAKRFKNVKIKSIDKLTESEANELLRKGLNKGVGASQMMKGTIAIGYYKVKKKC